MSVPIQRRTIPEREPTRFGCRNDFAGPAARVFRDDRRAHGDREHDVVMALSLAHGISPSTAMPAGRPTRGVLPQRTSKNRSVAGVATEGNDSPLRQIGCCLDKTTPVSVWRSCSSRVEREGLRAHRNSRAGLRCPEQHCGRRSASSIQRDVVPGDPRSDAHDAVGKSVPTTLEVSPPNVVTLTVHHRAGNPAAGGAPFTYPIFEGSGWEGGFSTFEVTVPPSEPAGVSRSRHGPRHAACRASGEGHWIWQGRRSGPPVAGLVGCIASGLGLKAGRVVLQSPAPGTSLPPWAPVTVIWVSETVRMTADSQTELRR